MAGIPEPLEVVIVGAGIAGLTAAIALRQHPRINVTLYDKATELREIGASIALGPNGLRTLERLELHDAISDEVSYRGPSNIPMIYRHWKTNEIIGMDIHENVTEYLHRTARYHRAHLHQALMANVPRDIIHLNKQILSVDADASREQVTLEFQDGTVVTADLLLGADGLRSGVRSSLVPDFQLKWSGWTAFRSIFDASLVESISGLPPDSTHWWGPDTNFFASRLGKNTYTVVGGVMVDPDDPNATFKNAEWDQDASIQLLREKYKDWNPVIKALTDVTPNIKFYPNLSCSRTLDTWVFGDRTTLIGDAAHAHGGAHATGGSLAIDDAFALYLSLISLLPLDSITKPSGPEIRKALELYQATRKPHADRLLETVYAANQAKAEKIRSGTLETDEELRTRAAKGSNTTWLHEHNVVETFNENLRRIQSSSERSAEISPKL